MKVSLLFIPFLLTPTDRIFGHIPTLNTSLCVVPAKEVRFGIRKMKFKVWPLLPAKKT